MKWKVIYDCGFDENDGDYCNEHGQMYHPTEGGLWVVDDTNKDDMKLLALVRAAIGIMYCEEDEDEEQDGTDNDIELVDALKADKFLTEKMEITAEEIEKFDSHFDPSHYFPSPHSCCSEPHDHWFDVEVAPDVDTIITDKFLLTPWKE